MRVSGVPWGGEHGHGTKSVPTTMGVVHNTYGQWAGDVNVVGQNGSSHFVIGKDEGQWIQLADTDSVTWNCGNWVANNCSVSIEFTGTSDEDLTPWQVSAGSHIIKEVSAHYGIPMNYDDGFRGPIDNPPFRGWYSHRAIRPDAGSQHSDFISTTEWSWMVGGVAPPMPSGSYSEGDFDMGQMEDLAQWEQDTRAIILDALVGDAWKDGSKGILATWMQDQSRNVIVVLSNNLKAALAALPTGSDGTVSATPEEIKAIVEQVVGSTHLTVG